MCIQTLRINGNSPVTVPLRWSTKKDAFVPFRWRFIIEMRQERPIPSALLHPLEKAKAIQLWERITMPRQTREERAVISKVCESSE